MKIRKQNTIVSILQGLRQGKESSFSLLYRQYYDAVTYYAYKFTDDRSTAEELAQSAFVNLWVRRNQIEHFDHIKAYLYTSVRNAWLNEQRQRQKNATRENKWAAMQEDPSNVMHRIIEAEVLQQVHSSITQLPKECSKVMKLLFIDGKSSKEIAREMGITVSGVKNHKARGIRILKKRLVLSLTFLLKCATVTGLGLTLARSQMNY